MSAVVGHEHRQLTVMALLCLLLLDPPHLVKKLYPLEEFSSKYLPECCRNFFCNRQTRVICPTIVVCHFLKAAVRRISLPLITLVATVGLHHSLLSLADIGTFCTTTSVLESFNALASRSVAQSLAPTLLFALGRVHSRLANTSGYFVLQSTHQVVS